MNWTPLHEWNVNMQSPFNSGQWLINLSLQIDLFLNFKDWKKFPKIEQSKILLINDERVLQTYILYISTYGRRPVHLFVYNIRYTWYRHVFFRRWQWLCVRVGVYFPIVHSYRLRCLNGILSTGLFLFIFLSLIKAVTIATFSYCCSFCFCFDGVPRHHDAC